MKEKVKLTKDEENTLVNPLIHTVLMHVTSPFERAAADNKFQPFQYKIAQKSIYVSNAVLHEIREFYFRKLLLLADLKHEETLSPDVPLELREIFYDPDELLPLPEDLKEALHKVGCNNLFTIMEKRRRYFETELRLDVKAIKQIEGLFAKHNLSGLFHINYHPGY